MTKPAQAFPVGEFIQEELQERGWTTRQLAIRMGGTPRNMALNELAVDMLIAVPEARIDRQMVEEMGRAFDVSAELFLNLDRTYHEWRAQQKS